MFYHSTHVVGSNKTCIHCVIATSFCNHSSFSFCYSLDRFYIYSLYIYIFYIYSILYVFYSIYILYTLGLKYHATMETGVHLILGSIDCIFFDCNLFSIPLVNFFYIFLCILCLLFI